MLVTFLFAGDAFADKILMKNGDRFQGTVNKVEGGILTFSTGYADALPLKISEIKKIQTEQPVTIHLINGKILRGRILPAKPDRIKVQAPSGRGYALIDWKDVKAVNPPPEKWKVSVSFGGSRDSGNTDRFSASLGAEAKRKFNTDQFEIRFRSNYSEADDQVTARNTFGATKFSHFLTPKWFSYLGLEFLSDTFRDLNLRTTVGPGLGYQIWDDDTKSLSLEGGYSYFYENRRDSPNNTYSTSRIAANFSYKIIPRLVFTDQVVIFPSLENYGEYTLRNEASLNSELGKGWKLKLSNIIEQNTDPGPDVQETDVHWILALGYDF